MDDNKRLGDDLNDEGWLALSPAERRLMRNDPTPRERVMAQANPDCWRCGGKGIFYSDNAHEPRKCHVCALTQIHAVMSTWNQP